MNSYNAELRSQIEVLSASTRETSATPRNDHIDDESFRYDLFKKRKFHLKRYDLTV